MKQKLIFAIAAAMFCLPSSAQAQSAQTSENESSEASSGVAARKYSSGWNNVFFQFHIMPLTGDGLYFGLSAEYNRTIGLSSRVPLYIQVGAGVQFASDVTDNLFGVDFSQSTVAFTLPVNLLYHFYIPNSRIGFEVYTGLHLTVPVYGCIHYSGSYDDGREHYGHYGDDDHYKIYTNNITSELNNPNVGWQIGGNANFGRFFLGVRYGEDFIDMYKNEYYGRGRAKTVSIGFGFRFGE